MQCVHIWSGSNKRSLRHVVVARKVSKGHSRRQQAQLASAMSCRDTDFQAGDPYEVVCMYVGCLRRWIGPGSLQFSTNAVSLAFRFTLVMYVCITKVLEEEGQKDAFNLQELCAVSIDFQQASRCPNLFQTSDVCNFGGSAVHRC